jgi:hypothetical protein
MKKNPREPPLSSASKSWIFPDVSLWKITMLLMGKSTISTGPFSIATLVYQRVSIFVSTMFGMNSLWLPIIISVWFIIIFHVTLATNWEHVMFKHTNHHISDC